MTDDSILSHEPPAQAVRVLVAPNAFKGSLTAHEAADAMAIGVRSALGDASIRVVPIADGGDGSVDCLVRVGHDRREFSARGPTLLPVRGSLALRGMTAVVEVANTCGMALLPDGVLEPLASSSAGLGDAIIAALDFDVEEIVVCLGGSASTDGGAGMLAALGAVMRDRHGHEITPNGATLDEIGELDLSGLDPRLAITRFVMAADVQSRLCGEEGAARMFAPQKGADPEVVERLDHALARWGRVLTEAAGLDVSEEPGAGAAGGMGAAVLAVLSASRVPGSDYFMSELGVAEAIDWADLVVTGEGRLDTQSALGKGALAVVELARSSSVPSIIVCGSIELPADELRLLGVMATGCIVDEAPDLAWAIDHAAEQLATATEHAVAASGYLPGSTRRA